MGASYCTSLTMRPSSLIVYRSGQKDTPVAAPSPRALKPGFEKSSRREKFSSSPRPSLGVAPLWGLFGGETGRGRVGTYLSSESRRGALWGGRREGLLTERLREVANVRHVEHLPSASALRQAPGRQSPRGAHLHPNPGGLVSRVHLNTLSGCCRQGPHVDERLHGIADCRRGA